MIKRKKYEKGTCEYVLARFCEAFKERDYKTMAEFCTYASRRMYADLDVLLEKLFGEYKTKDIDLFVWTTPTFVLFKPQIKIEARGKDATLIITAELTLIKQDRKRCLASPWGEWGVSPESFKVLGVVENKATKETTKLLEEKKTDSRKTLTNSTTKSNTKSSEEE